MKAITFHVPGSLPLIALAAAGPSARTRCCESYSKGGSKSARIYCHVGSEPGRKKQRCSACTARVTSAALTTSEMFTLDAPCEIICTSMSSSRSAAYTTASVADVETDASFTNETMARCGLICANDHEGA